MTHLPTDTALESPQIHSAFTWFSTRRSHHVPATPSCSAAAGQRRHRAHRPRADARLLQPHFPQTHADVAHAHGHVDYRRARRSEEVGLPGRPAHRSPDLRDLRTSRRGLRQPRPVPYLDRRSGEHRRPHLSVHGLGSLFNYGMQLVETKRRERGACRTRPVSATWWTRST